MKKLFLDVGNTRIKYMVSGPKEKSGTLSFNDVPGLMGVCKDVSSVYFSFVGDTDYQDEVHSILGRTTSHIKQVTSLDISRYFNPSYVSPELMGVDRWLALFAVVEETYEGHIVVVDAGTAMTIDVLKGKTHLGGLIVPGFNLQYSSLTGSAALPGDVLLKPETGLGNDTQSCMQQGVWSGLASTVDAIANSYEGSKIYISGGDGVSISKLIANKSILIDNVVLTGLRRYEEVGLA